MAHQRGFSLKRVHLTGTCRSIAWATENTQSVHFWSGRSHDEVIMRGLAVRLRRKQGGWYLWLTKRGVDLAFVEDQKLVEGKRVVQWSTRTGLPHYERYTR